MNVRILMHFFLDFLSRMNGFPKSIGSRRSTRETFLASLIWTSILTTIALPEGFKTKIGTIFVLNNATPTQIRKAWGPGDAGSLLDTALTWSKFHQIDPTTQFWIVHLWTPGMSIIEIPLIWITHIGIPIFWSLLFITIALWTCVFWMTWKYVSVLTGRLPIILIFITLALSWDFRYFLRDDLFYTEGLAFGFLVLGIGMLSWALITNVQNTRIFVIAGALIGFSIFIRHVSDFGLSMFCVLAVIGLIFQRRRLVSQRTKAKQSNRKVIKAKQQIRWSDFAYYRLIVAGVTANLILLPWRIISRTVYGGPIWLLSSAGSAVGPGAWTPNSKIGIWGLSGMNWACNIDPIKCDSLFKLPQTVHNDAVRLEDAVLAAIEHPFAYFKFRAHSLQNNWIPTGVRTTYFIECIVSLVPVALFLFSVFVLLRSRHLLRAGWVWLPFLVLEIGQLLLIQYESRYFIPVRLFTLGFYISVLAFKNARKVIESSS
jgi:hypothetical protein